MRLDGEIKRGIDATKKCFVIIGDLNITCQLSAIQTLIDMIAYQHGLNPVELYDSMHKSFINVHKQMGDLDTSALS